MGLLKADEKELEHLERTKWKRVGKTLAKDWRLYALLVPMLAFLILFRYMPIYGLLQGFKTYNAVESVLEQDWRGIGYSGLHSVIHLLIVCMDYSLDSQFQS